MDVAVGIDVAKEFHWAVATRLDPDSGKAVPVLSRRVNNLPADISALIEELAALAPASLQVGIDIVGSVAKLLEVMLIQAGLDVVHVPGVMVKNARQAARGGDHKSDPRDARVIADQVRSRDDLRTLSGIGELDAQLGLLVSRRTDLVHDQTRRITRLRDLLCSIHPGLERVTDPTRKADLVLLTRYITPAEVRRAGKDRITAFLRRTGRHKAATLDALVDAALTAAHGQTVSVPAEATAASIVKDLAEECLTMRDKITAVDAAITEALKRHPDAALIATLPGMGAVLTAELLAAAGGLDRFTSGDHLAAAAAGLAPGSRPIRQGPLPQTTSHRRPSPQTRLLPIRVLRHPTRPRQPRLLQPQTHRRQKTSPSADRARTPTHQRPLRHAPRPAALPGSAAQSSLTRASTCHLFRAACELVHTSTAQRRDPEGRRSADPDPQDGAIRTGGFPETRPLIPLPMQAARPRE